MNSREKQRKLKIDVILNIYISFCFLKVILLVIKCKENVHQIQALSMWVDIFNYKDMRFLFLDNYAS
jgi:hypothetical protein